MSGRKKQYSVNTINEVLKFAVLGTAASTMAIKEENRVELFIWIGEGKNIYKTVVAHINTDLSYELHDTVNVPLGSENLERRTVISETTGEEQARFAARQYTKYLIEKALTLF